MLSITFVSYFFTICNSNEIFKNKFDVSFYERFESYLFDNYHKNIPEDNVYKSNIEKFHKII